MNTIVEEATSTTTTVPATTTTTIATEGSTATTVPETTSTVVDQGSSTSSTTVASVGDPGTLPFTGGSGAAPALFGAALIAGGVLLGVRRRRSHAG